MRVDELHLNSRYDSLLSPRSAMATLSLYDGIRSLQQHDEQPHESLRVIQVINGEHYAGAERVQDLFDEYLPAQSIETQFVCVRHRQFGNRRTFGSAAITEIPVRQPWAARAGSRLARLVRSHNIDLLHAHTPRALWLAARAAATANVPLVYTLHDVGLSEPVTAARAILRAYTIRLLRQADGVIAVSPATLDVAERLGLGQHRVLIPNGVPRRDRTNFVSATPPVIGTVALLRPRKGIETLIEAVGRLHAARVDLRLRIVGPFEDREYARVIQREVDRAEIRSITEFPGFASDVNAELDAFDWFVMPSVLPEGAPMVVLEAMAAGLPVIGSDIAGVRELIRNRVDGMLVPPDDAAALAGAIGRALADRRLWSAMSEQAQRRQRALYSADAMALRTARCYREVRNRFAIAHY